MTGVVAGSGGTGVLEGSRPGTGVEGGAGTVTPLLLGTWTQDSTGWGSNPPTFVTPSVTARPGETTYLVFAQSTNTSDQPADLVGLTGMGLEWEQLLQNYYDPSTSGSIRSSIAVYIGRGVASDGALTLTMSNVLARAAVSVVAMDGKVFVAGATSNGGVGLNSYPTPPIADPVASMVLIGAAGAYDTSGTPPTFDPNWDELGFSGYGFRQQAIVTGTVPNDNDTTLDVVWVNGLNSNGAIAVGVTSTIPTYQAVLNSLSPSAQYPLAVKGAAADPPSYDTEAATLDLTTYVRPGTFGTGADPDPYDTEIVGYDRTTYIRPGAFGTGPDPENYETLIQDVSFDTTKLVPGRSLDAAAAQPNINDLTLTFDTTKFVPASAFQVELVASQSVISFTDSVLAGQQAGDMLVWVAGRSNASNDTTVTGSVQGSLTALGREATSISGGVFATVWDGVETFTIAHSITAGAQPGMTKFVLRSCTAVDLVASGVFGTDPGWVRATNTLTLPDMDVPAGAVGLMVAMSTEPSISAPYSMTNATPNQATPATTNSGNGMTTWGASRASSDAGDSVWTITGLDAARAAIGFQLVAS